MQWSFSFRDVVDGSIRYRLEDFRLDLMQQVESAFPHFGGRQIHGIFNLYYLLLYWLASGGAFENFVAEMELQLQPPTSWLSGYLSLMRDRSAADVEMLSAILRRMTLDGLEAGLPLQLALRNARAEQERIAATPHPTSRGAATERRSAARCPSVRSGS